MKSNSFTIISFRTFRTLGRSRKHRTTSPVLQIKEFLLNKHTIRPGTNYEWIGKTLQKKSDKNSTKK